MKKGFVILLFVVLGLPAWSQSQSELQDFLDAKEISTELVDSINALSKLYFKIDFDSSLIFSEKAQKWSSQINYPKGLAYAYYSQLNAHFKLNNYPRAIHLSNYAIKYGKMVGDTTVLAKTYGRMGLIYFNLNEFERSLNFHKLCLEQYLLTDNKRSTAIAYNNIGSALINLGHYKKAIQEFQKSIKLFDEVDLLAGTASCLLNIGQIYDRMGNSKDTVQNNKALSYYYKALLIYQAEKDGFKLAQVYNSIGIQYDQKATIYAKISQNRDSVTRQNFLLKSDNYYQKAIVNLVDGLEVFKAINYPLGVAQITNNIGTIYMGQSKFKVALRFLNESLNANLKSGNVKEIAVNRLSIAQCYRLMNRPELGLDYLQKGIFNVREVNIPIQYQDYYEEFALIYEELNNYIEAYSYYVRYTDVKDSLLRAGNLTTINEVQAVYENEITDKQLQLSSAKLREQKAVTEKKQFQIYGFSILVVLLLAIAAFIQKSLQNKKKSNIILADKNIKITHQKKEITDSITYASKIQTAVLPHDAQAKRVFKDSFVLLKPQHIVSGDFFWLKEIEDKNIVIATAADCTGHGVPGAFMSMLGMSLLNEIVVNYRLSSSGEILNHLRASVIGNLQQTGKEGEQKDGMDISLIAWHKDENYIEFSGANNPLYLVREGELRVFKGDKMPIGIHLLEDDFTSHRIDLQEGDNVYMFSDGFADQFGGPQGKKFKYKPFKDFILEIADEPMTKQKSLLNNKIEEWKAYIDPETNSEYQQIDDIVIFGIRF